MRRQDNVGEVKQRAVYSERFGLLHVQGSSGNGAAPQGLDQLRFVDYGSSCSVDDERAWLHHGNLRRPDGAPRLIVERAMDGDKVAALQQLRDRDDLHPGLRAGGQSAGGDEHVHAHRQGDVSDPRPDCAAASDEPDGLSVYLKVGQVTQAAPPHPVTQRQPLLLLHEGAAQVEHHGDGNVGHGLGAVRWNVAHSDALAPGCLHVDVVEPCEGTM